MAISKVVENYSVKPAIRNLANFSSRFFSPAFGKKTFALRSGICPSILSTFPPSEAFMFYHHSYNNILRIIALEML